MNEENVNKLNKLEKYSVGDNSNGVNSQTAVVDPEAGAESTSESAEGSSDATPAEAPTGVVEVSSFGIQNDDDALLSEDVTWSQAYDDTNNVGPDLGLPVQTGFFDDEYDNIADGEYISTNLVTYQATLDILASNTDESADVVIDFSDAVEMRLGVSETESTISGENFSVTPFDSNFTDVDMIDGITVDNDVGEVRIEIAQQASQNVAATFDLDLGFEAADPVAGLDIAEGLAAIYVEAVGSAGETNSGDIVLAFDSAPTGISSADAVNHAGVEVIDANIDPAAAEEGAYGQFVGSQILVQVNSPGDTIEIYEAARNDSTNNNDYVLGDEVTSVNTDTAPSDTTIIDTSKLGAGKYFIGFNENDDIQQDEFIFLDLRDLNLEVSMDPFVTDGETVEVSVTSTEDDAIRPDAGGGYVQLWIRKVGNVEVADVIHVDRQQLLGVTGDTEFTVDAADLEGEGVYRATVIHEDSGVVADSIIEIEDWDDLDAVRNDLDRNYALANDLDAETEGYVEHVDYPDNGWDPIMSFDGLLYGDGHEIADLIIDRPAADAVGLFGSISTGRVEHIALVDCDVTGRDFVGGLAGANGGTITEASVAGDIGGETLVGLLVGENDGEVTRSASRGTVIGTDNIGGLIGGNAPESTVIASYSTGDVTGNLAVGGICGINSGIISNSYSTGVVSNGDRAGGFLGDNQNGDVVDSYWDTETSGRADGIGHGEGDLTGLATTEMQGEPAANNMAALDFENTWVAITSPDEYPEFRWRSSVTVAIEPNPIAVDEKATVSIDADNITKLTIDQLWTDWQITPTDLDGATVMNLTLPGTPDNGTVELSWDSQTDVAVSLGIEPNYDTTPDPTYLDGKYALDIRHNDRADGTTAILEISDTQ